MNKPITKVIIALVVILLLSVVLTVVARRSTPKKQITNRVTNYEQCVAAGNPVQRSYPPQCVTPDGQTFMQEIPAKNTLDTSDSSQITTFEQCAAAGYPIMESFPEQCKTPDGRSFTRELRPDEKEQIVPPKITDPRGGSICKDTCGNGRCEEIVCMGSGCPCAETRSSCPEDCGAQNNRDIPTGWEPY